VKRRKVPWAWLAAACLVGGLLAGGLWWWQREDVDNGEDIADLALVPPDARGFVAARVADIWKIKPARNAFNQARHQLPPHDEPLGWLEFNAGLEPLALERVTAVFADADGEAVWFSVRTTQPYDRRGLLARLKGRQRLRRAGRKYHVGTTGDDRQVAFFFAGPCVLLLGPEAGVRRCLESLAEPRGSGPMDAPLKLAEGPDHVVGAYRPTEEQRRQAMQRLPEKSKDVAAARLAKLRMNIADKTALEFTLGFGGPKSAWGGKEAVVATLRSVQGFLLARRLFAGGEEAQRLERITAALASLKVKQNGNDVVVAGKGDTAALIGMALQLMPTSGRGR
jgi:hypothetical protein